MANRYWVGGTNIWNTTSTTNWSASSGGASGASVPTAADSVFFDQAGTYTVTMTGALLCLDITVSAGVVTFATGTTPTLAITGSMSLIAGTVWSSTGAITFNATTTGKTITTNGTTINGAITFNGVGGGWSLGSALVTGVTLTTTLTNGALTLNGFDLSTGIFSSSGTAARSVAFGANFINLVHTTAGTTVVSMATSTLFSSTGTGGFKANASITRTYTIGTTGGSTTTTASLFIPSGAAIPTLTTNSWFKDLVFTGSSTTPAAATLNIAGALTLSTGGTYTGLTINMVGTGTLLSTGKTIAALTINSTSGTTTLGDALTLVTNATTTLTSGTLALNDFNLNTGIFSSSNANTRSILFGLGNILLTHTTAATTVLNMATATGFTKTGTGGFSADASITRTYTFGTTGGTTTNAPNLSLTGAGTAIATITTASWFNTLSFGTTAFAMAATTLNLNSLTLSTGGTFTSLSMNAVGTGTITPNGKTIAAFTVNTAGTVTLAAAFGCTSYTQTTGTINFATFNLTSTGAASYTAGTLNNIGTISCTTWTHAASAVFTLSSGTISASTSFTVTSGTFTYTGGTITSPSFVHTAGTVNVNASLTLSATATYTFTAGTLTISDGFTLTTGTFVSNNANTRSIAFGTTTSGFIALATTTLAVLNLDMATATGFSRTGPGGFTTNMSVTRTFGFGTTAGGTSANAPKLYITAGVSVPTFNTGSWFDLLDFTGSSNIPAASTVNVNALTLSTGGTFTSLGINAIGTGTITPNGKTIAAFTVNNGAGTVTLAAALGCTTYTHTAGTINFATFNLTGSGAATYTAGTLSNIGTISCTTWTHAASAVFTLSSGTISASTSFTVTSGTFTYSGGTITTPSFIHTAGSVTTTATWTLPATCAYTLTAGTLTLGANLTVGNFSSSNANTRSIAWSTYSITLNHSTAATTVLNMAILTNYSFTGTQTFISDAAVTRTFSFGSTGGTITNAPALSFTGTGAGAITFATNSWFDSLNFGTTTSTIATAISLNLAGNLTLASGGTYTNMSVIYLDTGTITPNGKTIGALTINTSGTVTLDAALGCSTYTQTLGTFNFATFNLTCSSTAAYTAGTLSNIGTISCTTWTHNASAIFTLSSGTISASTSFTVTSGTFTYSGGTITTPSFVHTAGTVATTADWTLPATCVYTFTAGTITLGGNLTTASFISNNTNTRSIAWSTYSMTLNHSTTAQFILNVPNLTNYSFTGTQTFISDAAVDRTFVWGTTGGSITNSPNLSFTGTGAGVLSFGSGSWFENLDFGTVANTIVATTVNIAGNLSLSSSGTYTNLSVNTVDTGTYNGNSRSLGALVVNTSGTLTLSSSLGCTTWTQTLGTFNFATFNLTCSSTATYTAGTLSNIGTISCTTFTINGPAFNFTSGTINPSTSFVLTTGSFTLGASANLGATGAFTQTAGSVTFNKAYTLTATGTYTLTAGTLTLGGTLSTGIFISTNNNTRSIAFGAYNIDLTHTTASSNVIQMDIMGGFTWTGTGGFSSSMSNVRIFSCGNTSGATAANAFNLSINGGSAAATISGNSWFNVLDFTGYTGTPTAVNFSCAGLTLSTGGTFTGLTVTTTATGTIVGAGKTIAALTHSAGTTTLSGTLTVSGTTVTINTATLTLPVSSTLNVSTITLSASGSILNLNGGTIPTTATFNHTGTVNITSSVALTTTSTYTYTSGTLSISSGVTLSVGIFSSSNSNVRSIAFGSASAGNINLTHTTAATTVLVMNDTNSLTTTGPGGFTVSDMSVARTFTCGNAAGFAASAPNLTFTTGASVATITTGSWFNKIDFGTTSFTIPATTLNIKSLTLSSSGTYTALILTLVGSGTLTHNGKSTSTITAGAFTTTIVDCTCTTFTVNGSTINATGTGTFSATTSFVLNSGSVTFGSSLTLGSIPIFTHTSGSVTFNNTGSLGATSAYTLTAGTITLADGVTLSVGSFSSSNSNVRSIAFGSASAGYINLIHSTAGTAALNMGNSINFNWTGLGGFTSNMSVARVYNGANTANTFTSGSISAISAGQYVTAPANAGFVFGTGDFTVEAYIRHMTDTDGAVVDLRTGSTSPGPYFGLASSRLAILINGTYTIASTKLIRTNWYHVALCRTGTTTRIFVNGVKDLEFTDTTNYNVSGAIPAIGHNSSGGGGDGTLYAYISNVRIVKGVGAYVGNFTVPTSPLTTSQSASTNVNSILASQTTLLLNTVPGANYLVDSSLNNFTITNVGTSSSTATPFEASLPIGGKLLNLYINNGSSSPTFGLNSYFNDLDFTGSSTASPTSNTVNLQGNLTLSATGTYTDFSANVFGTSKAIVTNNIPLGTLYINSTSTTSLDATTANTITFSQGTLNLSGTLTAKNVYTTGTFTRNITGSDINVIGNTINSFTPSWEANGIGGSIFNSNAVTANLVSIASAPFADLNDFTFEVWGYGTSNTTAQHHFSWGDTGAGSSGSLRSVINMQNGHWQFWYGSSIRLETTSVETPYSPLINRWNHYAVTRTSTPTNTVTLWFNGKNVGSYAAGTDTFNNGNQNLMLGSDKSSPSCWVGYLSNFRYTSNNAVYYGNFTPPNTVLTATQSPSTNIRGIYGAQTVVLMTMSSPLTYLMDSSALPKRVENVGGVTFSPFAPPLIDINSNLTVSSTIRMTSNNSKIFSGGGGTYGSLNQGGGGTLTITGNNSFFDINNTNTVKAMNVTFKSGTTQTVGDFNIFGVGTNGGPAGAYPLGSVTLNGTTQYLTLPAAPTALTFGTGEFTIECWCRLNSLTDGAIYDARTAATSIAPYFYMSSGQPSFMVNNVAVLGGGGANPTRTLTTDTWYHLAIAKSGSSTRMYVDGVQVGTTYTDTNTYVCGTPAIGHNSTGAGGTGFLSATFSNIRIVKGVGVYTGNFIVPVNPLDITQSSQTNISAITGTQTSLLLNTPNSASFLTDTSSTPLTVTNNGTVVSSSFQPFKTYINTTIPGIAATLTKSTGIVSVNSLYIQDSIATGGASWYAGAYSVNVSNNSGWVFSGAPSTVNYSNFFAFF